MADPLERCRTKHTRDHIISYADYIFVIVAISEIDACIVDLEQELSDYRLTLNPKKCTVWPTINVTDAANLKRVTTFEIKTECAVVLGIPIDGDVNSFLEKAVKDAGDSITIFDF